MAGIMLTSHRRTWAAAALCCLCICSCGQPPPTESLLSPQQADHVRRTGSDAPEFGNVSGICKYGIPWIADWAAPGELEVPPEHETDSIREARKAAWHLATTYLSPHVLAGLDAGQLRAVERFVPMSFIGQSSPVPVDGFHFIRRSGDITTRLRVVARGDGLDLQILSRTRSPATPTEATIHEELRRALNDRVLLVESVDLSFPELEREGILVHAEEISVGDARSTVIALQTSGGFGLSIRMDRDVDVDAPLHELIPMVDNELFANVFSDLAAQKHESSSRAALGPLPFERWEAVIYGFNIEGDEARIELGLRTRHSAPSDIQRHLAGVVEKLEKEAPRLSDVRLVGSRKAGTWLVIASLRARLERDGGSVRAK
jgi:hypothetical protein